MLSEDTRRASAKRLGNLLFVPALTIPAVTVIVTLAAPRLVFGGTPLVDPKNATLVGFGIGCVVALAVACYVTRDTVGQSAKEARRLIDALSWAAVLPQMLGMLGLVFADAGVGKAVAHVATAYVNLDYRFVAVAVYCIGMALFTMVMGNGFAAFPVMTGGIGVPILVNVFHGDPAVMVAIGKPAAIPSNTFATKYSNIEPHTSMAGWRRNEAAYRGPPTSANALGSAFIWFALSPG